MLSTRFSERRLSFCSDRIRQGPKIMSSVVLSTKLSMTCVQSHAYARLGRAGSAAFLHGLTTETGDGPDAGCGGQCCVMVWCTKFCDGASGAGKI
eukprot:955582-Pelagomonas_calceolata.AAC.3